MLFRLAREIRRRRAERARCDAWTGPLPAIPEDDAPTAAAHASARATSSVACASDGAADGGDGASSGGGSDGGGGDC
jgi:uncharacterized membrane protein YgcG